MDTPNTYQERIYQHRPGFSRSYHLLADFLLDSTLQAALMTAHELAQALDLDPATVVRFAQSLGYPGYPALQQELRQNVLTQYAPLASPGDRYTPFDLTILSLRQTRANLDLLQIEALVDRIAAAPRILFSADPAGQTLAGQLAAQLIAAGFPTSFPAADAMQAAALLATGSAGDLLLAIDLLGGSSCLHQSIHLAKEHGMTVALLAGAASLPSAGEADHLLCVFGAEEPSTRLACAAAITQTLTLSLQQRFPERFSSAGERLHEILIRLTSQA